MNIDTNELI